MNILDKRAFSFLFVPPSPEGLPSVAAAAGEANWYEEEESLRRRSLLRGHAPPASALLALNLTPSQVTPSSEALALLQPFLPDLIEQSVFWERRVQELIASNNHEALYNLAQEIALRVQALAPGEKTAFFTGVSFRNREAGQSLLAKKLVEKALPIAPHLTDFLLKGKKEKLEALVEKHYRKLEQELQQQLTLFFPESTEEFIRNLLASGLEQALPDYLREGKTERLVKMLSDSIKRHIKRALFSRLPGDWQGFSEAFAGNIVDLGVKEALRQEMEQLAKKAPQAVVDHSSGWFMQGAAALLPAEIRELLHDVGFFPAEHALWLEIEKDETGTLSLSVRGAGEALDHHPSAEIERESRVRTTLFYEKLRTEQLGADFLLLFSVSASGLFGRPRQRLV